MPLLSLSSPPSASQLRETSRSTYWSARKTRPRRVWSLKLVTSMLFTAVCLRATRRAPITAILARRNSTIAEPVVLRPYQEDCLDSCLDALAAGSTRIGVSLPTGAGKTTVFISLVGRMKSQDPARTKGLVIVNSIELAKQAALQATRLFPNWTVEIEQGQEHVATANADL